MNSTLVKLPIFLVFISIWYQLYQKNEKNTKRKQLCLKMITNQMLISDHQPEPAYFDSNDTCNTDTIPAPFVLVKLGFINDGYNWDTKQLLGLYFSSSPGLMSVGSEGLSITIITKWTPRCSVIRLNLIPASQCYGTLLLSIM